MNVVHIILFVVSACCISNVSVIDDRRVKALMKDRRKYVRVRCTRRYSVGNCLEPVRPVWTFVAHLQTCTERLGCPAHLYSNRFNTFEECHSVCRELIFLFMYLQSSLENDTFRVPSEGPEAASRTLAEVKALYNEFNMAQDEDSSIEETEDEEPPNVEHDFRRDFNEAISALPSALELGNLDSLEPEPDLPEDQTTTEEPSDDRPPLPSREEMMPDDSIIEPDIDKFP